MNKKKECFDTFDGRMKMVVDITKKVARGLMVDVQDCFNVVSNSNNSQLREVTTAAENLVKILQNYESILSYDCGLSLVEIRQANKQIDEQLGIVRKSVSGEKELAARLKDGMIKRIAATGYYDLFDVKTMEVLEAKAENLKTSVRNKNESKANKAMFSNVRSYDALVKLSSALASCEQE